MTKVYRPGGLAQDPLYCYHLSERLGIIVLAIYKNACTTQKRWLLDVEGIEYDEDLHIAAFNHLSLLTRPVAVRDLALAKLPIIGFLRDPLLRLASAYRDKLIGDLGFPSATAIEGAAARRGVRIVRDSTAPFRGMGKDALLAACSGVDYERGLSFREFVEYVVATPELELDPHWRSQTWFLGPINERARRADPPKTVLVPMQRVGEVLGQVGHSKGIAPPETRQPQTDTFAPPAEDLSDIPSGALRGRERLPHASELYDERIVELVLERFAPDIALWNRFAEGASSADTILAVRAAAA